MHTRKGSEVENTSEALRFPEGEVIRAILQTLGSRLPISQPLTSSILRSDAGSKREREVVPSWPGACWLPGLGTLAQTQPFCWAGAKSLRALRTKPATTVRHANTIRVQDLHLLPIPWGSGCYLLCLHLLTLRLRCPQNTQTHGAGAVGVFYCVPKPGGYQRLG